MLEIIRTTVANDYTTTAIASTVIATVYKVDGEEKVVEAPEGHTLVLVVDGVQKDLVAGAEYNVKEVIAGGTYDATDAEKVLKLYLETAAYEESNTIFDEDKSFFGDMKKRSEWIFDHTEIDSKEHFAAGVYFDHLCFLQSYCKRV